MGVLPCGDQVPPLEKDVNDDQDSVNPLHLTDEAIRSALFQMAQVFTTQAQDATTQAQVVTAQANQEVVPQANEQVATMASRLRYFT